MRTWPAVILAKRRKHRVIGRTEILINSTIHKNGTRYQGEFEGSREEGNLNFTVWIKTPPNQHERAAPKLKPNVVVIGYL